MPIERKNTVILALEYRRRTKNLHPEEVNDLISKIEADNLSPDEEAFIDCLLKEDGIIPVFSRGASC